MKNMTAEQETLLLIRGTIASLPEEYQRQVAAAHDAIKDIVKSNKEAGTMAVALLGAEMAAE